MKHCALLVLLFALGCMHVRAAPVEQDSREQGSCEDPVAKSAAELALTMINRDRKEGYIFALHRLSNVHMTKPDENGIVFYLNLDVVETNCSVLSKRDQNTCEARPAFDTPVYGQCKAAIFINRVQRVTRLYKYSCMIRPVPAARVVELCPDCPSHVDMENAEVKKTVTLSLEDFNKKSTLSKHFSLLKVNRAMAGSGMVTHYNVEYTIQETVCPKSTEVVTAATCPLMDCEFAHYGFCKGSLFYSPTGDPNVNVECEIYEPEAAEREKKLHMLGGETDHSHSGSSHDHAHDHGHAHDHVHADGHRHSHKHSHDHGHGHSHTHTHLHEHEHHHHHHEHHHNTKANNNPEGMVRMLPAMDQAMTLPSFPDVPAAGPEVGVVLPLKPDPQIPGAMEPVILSYPTTYSAQCPVPAVGATLVEKMFNEDPMFKPAA